MNHQSKSALSVIVIVILLFCIVAIGYNYFYARSGEVNAAEKFINKLYKEDMVFESESIDTMTFESYKKNDLNNPGEYYTVNTRDFGIDLDSEFNVIGFKNKVCVLGQINITEEEALALAKKYVNEVYDGDVVFKEFITEDAQNLPYYTLYFNKYYSGYPYYNDNIVINIDKEKGTLDGYSNISTLKKPSKIKINTDVNVAKEVALEEAESFSTESKVKEEPFMAFYTDKDKTSTELCYVVTVEGIGIDGVEGKWKYFISTEKGKVINFIKDSITSVKVVK